MADQSIESFKQNQPSDNVLSSQDVGMQPQSLEKEDSPFPFDENSMELGSNDPLPDDFDGETNTLSDEADSHYGSIDNQSSTNSNGLNSLRKRRLMKKAPDAPKRFKSAYICFVTEKMDDVKKNLPPDMKVTEMMKTLAYMWKNLPPLERMEYDKKAEADKSRYFEEMARYEGPLQVPNKRQKKPAGAPKRAMSAFLSYSQQMRPQIRSMYPDLKNTDLSSILAQKWHNAQEEEKRPHLERERREREKYHEEMAHWKEEEEKRHQEERQEKKRQIQHQKARNTIDFLDLPSSSSIWESLEESPAGENDDLNGGAPALEKDKEELTAFWEETFGEPSRKSSQGIASLHPPLLISSKAKSSSSHHHRNAASKQQPFASSTNSSKAAVTVQPRGSLKVNPTRSTSTITTETQKISTRRSPSAGQVPSRQVPSSSGATGSRTMTSNASNATTVDNQNGFPPPLLPSSSSSSTGYPLVASENPRFYAVPFQMSDGQISYAAFNVFPSEYALSPGYFHSSNENPTITTTATTGNSNGSSGGGGEGVYPRYPYPIHPFYARLPPPHPYQQPLQQQAQQQQHEKEGLFRYNYSFAGHPNYPPLEAPIGEAEGYWQWRNLPPPPAAAALSGPTVIVPMKGTTEAPNNNNNSNNNNNNNEDNRQGSTLTTANSRFVTNPYLYNLNYLHPFATTPIPTSTTIQPQTSTLSSSRDRDGPSQQSIRVLDSSSNSSSANPSKRKRPAVAGGEAIEKPKKSQHSSIDKRETVLGKAVLSSCSDASAAVPLAVTAPVPPSLMIPTTADQSAVAASGSTTTPRDPFNPLDNVAETLRAIQRSGFSGGD